MTVARAVPLAGFAGRGYEVIRNATHAVYPSVTSVLNIVGKSGLPTWAVNQSLESVRQELVGQQGKGWKDAQSDEWINGMLERASKAAALQLRTAADFGTRAHAAINAIIQEKPGSEPVPLDLRPVVDSFRRWYDSSAIHLCSAGDTIVYNRVHGYAGSADAIGRTSDGRLTVVDFKTSNSVHTTYGLQVAAYAYAVKQMCADGELDVDGLLGGGAATASEAGYSVPRSMRKRRYQQALLSPSTPDPMLEQPVEAIVLRLDKRQSEFEELRVSDPVAAFDAFKAALLLWHAHYGTSMFASINPRAPSSTAEVTPAPATPNPVNPLTDWLESQAAMLSGNEVTPPHALA